MGIIIKKTVNNRYKIGKESNIIDKSRPFPETKHPASRGNHKNVKLVAGHRTLYALVKYFISRYPADYGKDKFHVRRVTLFKQLVPA